MAVLFLNSMERSLCPANLPSPDLGTSITNEADTDDSISVNSELGSVEEDSLDVLDSSDASISSPDDSDGSNQANLEITCAILKALNLVDQMQGSLSDFEDLLDFSKQLFCRNDSELKKLWPKNWRETQALLRKCGYKDPKELYICLDESHYCHWDVMESSTAVCKYCGKQGTIKYYYLSISDKIQQWCANEAMCKKMMAHWEDKGHWMQGEGANFTLKEVWDGSRFNELSWFWNPESNWMLPVKCTFCKTVISVDEILAFPEKDGKHVITCDECGTQWIHAPIFTTGDPRNSDWSLGWVAAIWLPRKYFSPLCKKVFISINFLYSSFNCSL